MARQNLCPNPKAKNDAAGWSGTATPARVTGLTGFPVGTGVKSGGVGFIQSPTGACGPGDELVVSLYQQSPTVLGNKTVFVAFTRSSGGDDFSQTFTTNLDTTVRRTTATVTAPADATGVYLLLDGVSADVVMTAVMFEPGTVDGGYADGDTDGWVWDGADGDSTSTEQPVQVIPDGIAVPVGLGTPAVAVGQAAAPGGVVVPVALGQPAVSPAAAAPAGLPVAVGLGQPAAGSPLAAVPAGLAVPVHLGTPSTRAAPVTSARGPVLRASSRKPVLLSAKWRR